MELTNYSSLFLLTLIALCILLFYNSSHSSVLFNRLFTNDQKSNRISPNSNENSQYFNNNYLRYNKIARSNHVSKVNNRHLLELSSNSSLIKGYKGRGIYIFDNGIKHHIPDWLTFIGMGFDLSQVKSIPDNEIEALPEGEPLSQVISPYERDANGNIIVDHCPCEHKVKNQNTLFNSSICIINNSELTQDIQTHLVDLGYNVHILN